MLGYQITFRDIKLVNLGEKPGCLEFYTKAGLDQIPVVVRLMMMKRPFVLIRVVKIC